MESATVYSPPAIGVETDGYTAVFLFRNPHAEASPYYRPSEHLPAMWRAYRSYLTQDPILEPTNIRLIDHVCCAPEFRVEYFLQPAFACVLRAIEGIPPEKPACFVPNAELIMVKGNPAQILARLEQGLIFQARRPGKLIALSVAA